MNRTASLPAVSNVPLSQSPVLPTAYGPGTQTPQNVQTPVSSIPSASVSKPVASSDKNELSGDAALAATAVAGAGLFSAVFLPMWIYIALMVVVLLILLWCIRNVAVDSKGKSIKDTAKYQAVALISVLLLGIGAGTAYYLNKMCREDSNPGVMWGIAVASPIILVFLLAYLIQMILGTFYYTLGYAYGFDDKAKQKELEAIAAAVVPPAAPAVPAVNPPPAAPAVPAVRPGGGTA